METIFMNLQNSKTAKPHRTVLSLIGKINPRRSDALVALASFSIYSASEKIKISFKKI